MTAPLKVLFVCGRNRRRSPTAERIFRDDPRLSVRSAGTSETSKRRITESDLNWADLVLVMEPKYAAWIRALFPTTSLPPLRSLDIPDEYDFMDAELIELLEAAVESDPELHRFGTVGAKKMGRSKAGEEAKIFAAFATNSFELDPISPNSQEIQRWPE